MQLCAGNPTADAQAPSGIASPLRPPSGIGPLGAPFGIERRGPPSGIAAQRGSPSGIELEVLPCGNGGVTRWRNGYALLINTAG